MLDASQIERIKYDIQLDKSMKSNLTEELAKSNSKLEALEKNISSNKKDINTIEEILKNIKGASDNIVDAIKDMDSYFQGNLANRISGEYSDAEHEIVDIYNQLVDEYNRLIDENESTNKQCMRLREDIEDLERRIEILNNNIEENTRKIQEFEAQVNLS